MKLAKIKKVLGASFLFSALWFCSSAQATIVQFQTSLGDFEVNLYDDTTPLTVENFLLYLDAGAYERSIVHRSVTGFVVQGGGFSLNDENQLQAIETPWSPLNEPVYANVRGTIAMAKKADDENSATSQWFFNLSDNRANLDNQNGGFTVFGQVVGEGMQVVDAIAALQRFNVSGAFTASWAGALTEVPFQQTPADNVETFLQQLGDYLVVIESITVLDAATDTAADLDRPLRTQATMQPTKRKKRGGAVDETALLLLLGGLMLARQRRVTSD